MLGQLTTPRVLPEVEESMATRITGGRLYHLPLYMMGFVSTLKSKAV